MTTLIPRRAGAFRQGWRAMGLDRAGFDLDLRMWLVTVPAVALAVTTGPVVRIFTHQWLNILCTFCGMFVMATLCSLAVLGVIRRVSSRGRSADLLLSCWWVGAGAAVWMPAGWTAAIAGAAGAAVLLHLMVRQLTTVRLHS